MLESDEWLRYYIPEGQWSRADGLRGRRLCPQGYEEEVCLGCSRDVRGYGNPMDF